MGHNTILIVWPYGRHGTEQANESIRIELNCLYLAVIHIGMYSSPKNTTIKAMIGSQAKFLSLFIKRMGGLGGKHELTRVWGW